MTNRVLTLFMAGLSCMAGLPSCTGTGEQDEKPVRAIVPVTVISPRAGKMAEYTELIATSAFLAKTVIKSPLTGYVEKCLINPGDKVVKNQLLFQLRTRESMALEQDSLRTGTIEGVIKIKATIDGVIATVDHPRGDFVQEGDLLSTIIVPGSLVFLLEVPYEIKNMVRVGAECKLKLPDNSVIGARVKSVLPAMSGASQTQRMVLEPHGAVNIPENLMAKVDILRSVKDNALILPKSCLLNDEVMQHFWVMKLINDSTAVKVPVTTGIQGTDSIEVVSPLFNAADRILTSGNYGLGDTAIVRIIKHEL